MLIELVRQAAAEVPDQPVVVTVERSLSYGECLARSESIAAGLEAAGIDRFAAVLDDADDVLVLMAGSSAVGVECCCYPLHLDAAGVAGAAATFGHRVVFTRRDLVVEGLDVRSPDSLSGGAPSASPPEHAPVLILTTGTTGAPKGARHDWARLVAPVRSRRAQPGSRWFLGYDLNQFAGVQLLLHVLATRATLVAAPSRFAARSAGGHA